MFVADGFDSTPSVVVSGRVGVIVMRPVNICSRHLSVQFVDNVAEQLYSGKCIQELKILHISLAIT